MRPTSSLALLLLAACNPDAGLTKFNSEPEAQITAPSDGSAVLEGTTVTLRGAASDPNHATGELLARWFVGDEEACASTAPAADGTTTCEVRVPEGEAMTVRLEVLDPAGAAGTAEATYAITPNAAPTASIASPLADGVYYSDQLVTFRGTVADAEDAPEALTAWWEDGATRLEQVESAPNGSGEVLGYAVLAEGPHALELHVQDTAGNETVATVLVNVGPPNSAPDCVITAPVDGSSVEQGVRVDIEGLATDIDVPSSTLQVAWTSDKDGALGTSTPDSDGSVGLSTSTLSADTHRLTMRVTDEVGAECTTSIVLTVGTPPTLEVLTPIDGDVVNEGDDVDFLAMVSDAEDRASDMRVPWERDLDGLLDTSTPDSTGEAGFLRSDLSWGEHALTVTATDSAGLYAVERLSFTVNGLPTAPVVSLSPSSPYGSDDLIVSMDVSSVDPEGDRLMYAYAWYQNGVLSSASTSATLPSSATSRGDRWTVEVWASDGYGESPVASAGVTIGDTLPTVASVTLSPGTAQTNDTLSCVASGASDTDGDTVSLGYAWTVNGTTLSETGSTLAGTWFDKGDVVVCSVTPTAGSGVGTSLSSAPLTIDNTVPTVTSASIAPASPRTGDTLTCVTTGWTDADGDADGTTYVWSVNGRAAGTGRSLAGGFVGGDVVACVATPFDGEDAGSPVTASVTVGNTAPVLASATLSPSTPREGDTLSCTPGSTTDADGTSSFTYTYGWRVNGVAIAATTSTLSSTSFDDGDTVACVVTPNDGTTNGSAVTSNTVTVANTAPTLASVTITPDPPTRSSTLTCTPSGASDADGDVVSYTYRWTVDGVASGSGATLTGPFAVGALIACTVTPTDGKDTGAAVTDTATVTNTAPVVTSVTLSPSAVRTNDTLTANVVSSDADGDTVSLTYTWYVNGSVVSGATSNSLSGVTSFNKGDVVYASVTPSDASGAGTTVASGSVTVADTAPTTPGIAIAPTSPAAGDDLVCSVVTPSVDADGDTVTYAFAWDVDGAAYSSASTAATSSTVDGADVGGDETWTCEVTAGDGTGTSGVATASVTRARLGSSATAAAFSCLEILNASDSVGDGTYWVNPDGTSAYQVYCDMTTDGGGWTLMAKFSQHRSISNLSTSMYDSYFRTNLWIDGFAERVPTSPVPSYDAIHVESVDWSDFLMTGQRYELRQRFFKATGTQAFDVGYTFTYNGYTDQNSTSGTNRAWELSTREVFADTTGITWNTPTETVRFWLPFKEGVTGSFYTGCYGYEYGTTHSCGSITGLRRYGNAGIMGATMDSRDPAAAWAPDLSTEASTVDMVYVYQATGVYGYTSAQMALLYYIR